MNGRVVRLGALSFSYRVHYPLLTIEGHDVRDAKTSLRCHRVRCAAVGSPIAAENSGLTDSFTMRTGLARLTTLHIFGLSRLAGMLLSPWAFTAR